MPTDTDDALVQKAARGDRPACDLLVQRHRDWVRGLLEAITGDRDQAEDLTQEAFCRLLRGAGAYAPRGQFTAWFKRVVVNLGRDHLRTRRRRPLLSWEDVSPPPMAGAQFDPARVWESRVLRDELKSALARLPEEQSVVVLRHYFGGETVPQIAAALGCPEGTVKTRLFHGRRRVRQFLTKRETP